MSDEYSDYVLELLAGLGPVQARRMFGGRGLFLDGLMFALIIDDILYFKVDDQNRPDFEALSLPPFSYQRQGRKVDLAYRRAPDEAFDDAGIMCEWARKSVQAAVRAAARERQKKGRRKPD